MNDYNQSKSPPIPTSSSSSFGGGGGAYFFYYFFFPFSSPFLSAAGAAVAGVAATGALDPAEGATPPKLKNEEMSFPSSALAKSLGQKLSTLTPAAEMSLPIFSPAMTHKIPVMSCPSS